MKNRISLATWGCKITKREKWGLAGWLAFVHIALWLTVVPAPAATKSSALRDQSKNRPKTVHMKRLEEKTFGKMPDGTEVKLYTLRNSQGMVAKVTSYGAILT